MLVREDEGGQNPVYYANEDLKEAELNYWPLEKLAFAVMLSTTKLRPCFEFHTIEVRTNYPLRRVLHRLELSGQLST